MRCLDFAVSFTTRLTHSRACKNAVLNRFADFSTRSIGKIHSLPILFIPTFIYGSINVWFLGARRGFFSENIFTVPIRIFSFLLLFTLFRVLLNPFSIK